MKALVLILVVLVSGGVGYYFLSYQPAQYAKQVLTFYDEAAPSFQTLFGGNLQSGTDYDAAMQVLAERTATLGQLKEKIATLQPPRFGDLKNIQPDLEGSVDDFTPIIADAKDTLTFLIKLTKLKKLLRPDSGAFADQRGATMGDMARYIDKTNPEIIALGSEIFSGTAPKLNDAEVFEKLKASWEGVAPGLMISGSMAHRLDPTTHLANFSMSLLNEQELAASNKMEQFQRLLDQAFLGTTANDVLSYRFLTHQPGVIPASVAARGERIGQTISKLQKQYGK